MARVRVEGIVGRIVSSVEWDDGKISGDPVLLKAIEQRAVETGRRFYDDPLAFAALASSVVERYSTTPARVTSEDVVEPLADAMSGVTDAAKP